MAKITPDDVIKLARLARIDLTDDEIDSYAAELAEIIQYVEILQAVDVDGLKPTNQVTGLVNVTRPDMVVDYGYKPEKLLENVPTVENGLIKVKRMVG